MAMRSLTDDMDHYHRAFGVYHRVADRYNVLSQWVNTELRQAFKSMNVNYTDGKEDMKILSIGPGDGEIENQILRILRDGHEPPRPIKATIVEPAVDMVYRYKTRVVKDTAQLTDISYDWRAETLDAYLENGENDGAKFHFISALHSIYYASDMQAAIKDLYGRLEDGGILLMVVISDKSGFGRFGSNFPLMWGSRHHHPTSAQVLAACQNENIPIDQEFITKVQANITPCFNDPQDMTQDGRLLVDFFTHVADFLKDAQPETKKEVLEFLGGKLCAEKREDGQVYFHGDWKAFIIRR
ncbi:histamine N-methyltransferase-like [Asterias rubens]|uniref:histamine N-methyltransferase-like n=1 Tax=Asterias rubens TaxID=7604 RepID=UPI0014553965|nr:histamine N-methyltransferase-like [Asterias rubens]